MAETNFDNAIKNLTANLAKFEDKSFNVYFMVYDTKGRASGELAYIYRTAYALSKEGYKVSMLYQLTEEEIKAGEEFVGVEGWLGEAFASLPHYNVYEGNVDVSPSDFMIIPEVFADVMVDTDKAHTPCKRIALLYNYGLVQLYMPKNRTWPGLGVRDVVTTTEHQKELIESIFGKLNTRIVRPCVAPVFQKNDKPREMSVNIIARDPSDFKRVTALFYWKYPYLKWVRFNELTEISQELFAENLKNAPITVWLDAPTYFGVSALEAMKCGSLVIGKVPEEDAEWMFDNEGVKKNGFWFYNINEVHDLIAGAVNSFLNDKFPMDRIVEGEKTASMYTPEKQAEDIKRVYIDGIFEDRKKELEIALDIVKKNKEKSENTTENE